MTPTAATRVAAVIGTPIRHSLSPAIYNAANEVCVEAFRQGRLAFTQIVPTVASVLAHEDVPLTPGSSLTVEDVLAADAWARGAAAGFHENSVVRSSSTQGGNRG